MTQLLIRQQKLTAYNGPPRDTVPGGAAVRCPNGHTSSYITRSYDLQRKDYYVEAECRALDCGASSRVYDKDRNDD